MVRNSRVKILEQSKHYFDIKFLKFYYHIYKLSKKFIYKLCDKYINEYTKKYTNIINKVTKITEATKNSRITIISYHDNHEINGKIKGCMGNSYGN